MTKVGHIHMYMYISLIRLCVKKEIHVHVLHLHVSNNVIYSILLSHTTHTAEKARLNELVSSLETKLQTTSKELEELQIKMKGVTEYFQEKEHTLHAKLEAGEQKRLKVENLESEAHVKAAVAEQERQKDRQELNELRDQMKEIERSYISQVKNNEQRAEDAIVSLVDCWSVRM